MFHIAKACYPINDATYASAAEVDVFIKANFKNADQVSAERFKSMGVFYDIVPGENPVALRRKAGTSTTRATAAKAVGVRKPISAERQYDLTFNEGCEGYNPHRIGDVPTYWRAVRR